MIYGYARVSTTGQALNGTSLDDQERALKEAGAEEIFKDAYTGTTADRPELNALLERLVSGDRLIVTKLDRLSRSASDGHKIIQDLLARGVAVHVLNMGLIDNTPTGKLIIQILLAFAEFERDSIVERTQAGRARKKAEGTLRDGRPPKDLPELDKYMHLVKTQQMTMSEACRQLGISQNTWYARLKKKEKQQAL